MTKYEEILMQILIEYGKPYNEKTWKKVCIEAMKRSSKFITIQDNNIVLSRLSRIYETVILYTCDFFGITRDEFKTKKNTYLFSYPRQHSYQIIYDLKYKYFSMLKVELFAEYIGFDRTTGFTRAKSFRNELKTQNGTLISYNILFDAILKELKRQDNLLKENKEYEIIPPAVCKKINIREKTKSINYKNDKNNIQCKWCGEKAIKPNETRCSCCGYDIIKKKVTNQ